MGYPKCNINCCKLFGFASFLLILKLYSHVNAFSTTVTTRQRITISTLSSTAAVSTTTTTTSSSTTTTTIPISATKYNRYIQDFGEDTSSANNFISSSSRRRSLLMQFLTTTTTTTMMMSSSSACYATSSTIDPETAYRNLRKAREELVAAGRIYFPKRNVDGLREYLNNEELNINSYDANASSLLKSKRLDAESKKEIGTIRRFGVGADVIIMYGALKSELSEDNERPNGAEIEKYYIRALDSLEEVIMIVRSNPGFSEIS